MFSLFAPATPAKIPVWETVRIPKTKELVNLLMDLFHQGIQVNQYVLEIFTVMPLSDNLADIEISLVTGGDLGFKKPARRREIFSRAEKMGLHPLPPVVAPEILLRHAGRLMTDQTVTVAMNPVCLGQLPVMLSVTKQKNGGYINAQCVDVTPIGQEYRWFFGRRPAA